MGRHAERVHLMDGFIRYYRDFCQATRALARAPVFTVSVVGILALTLGATIAVVTVAHGVLWTPLPFPESDRLVRIWKNQIERGFDHFPIRYDEYLAWQDAATSFQSIAVVPSTITTTVLYMDARPKQVALAAISPNLFDVLRVQPALGRAFEQADTSPTAAPPMILSHRFWRDRFGADESVVGSLVEMDLGTHRRGLVVGVMPSEFDYPSGTEVWSPALAINPDLLTRGFEGELIGRLANASGLIDAGHELQRIHSTLVEESALESPGAGVPAMAVVVAPLLRTVVGTHRNTIHWFLLAAAFMLSLATANLAGLFLLRAEERGRELAVRCALGADKWSLVRPLVSESILVASLGFGAGLIIASWILHALIAASGRWLPRIDNASLNPDAIAISSIGLVLACGGFGVAPALLVSGRRRIGSLMRGAVAHKKRIATALVVAEVALAMALLISSGLLVRTLAAQQDIDRGFDAESLISLMLPLKPSRYPEPRTRLDIFKQAAESVGAVPGVASATPMFMRPSADEIGFVANFRYEGQTEEQAKSNPWGNFEFVMPNFFETFRIPLLYGRVFNDKDRLDTQRVAIVSQSVAEDYWPGEDPIGKSILTRATSIRVVGVVGDVRYRELTHNWYSLYFPVEQNPFQSEPVLLGVSPNYLVVRTATNPQALIPAIRDAVRRVDPAIALDDVALITDILDSDFDVSRFNANVTLASSLVAALIAALGVYGLVSSLFARRRFEVGLRMAVGATPRQAAWIFLRSGLFIAASGIVLGWAVAGLSAHALESLLYGVAAIDPMTYGLMASAVFVLVQAASWVPARRASRVNPVEVLKQD